MKAEFGHKLRIPSLLFDKEKTLGLLKTQFHKISNEKLNLDNYRQNNEEKIQINNQRWEDQQHNNKNVPNKKEQRHWYLNN